MTTVLDEAIEPHFEVPVPGPPPAAAVAIPGHELDVPSNFLFEKSPPGETIRLEDLLPEGFPCSGGGRSSFDEHVSSPLRRRDHRSIAPATSTPPPPKPAQRAVSKPLLQRKRSIESLRAKCARLYNEKELFADYLDSALKNLEAARAELQVSKKLLEKKGVEIEELKVSAGNLKVGMVCYFLSLPCLNP